MNTLAELLPRAMSTATTDGRCVLPPMPMPRTGDDRIYPHLERDPELVPPALAEAFTECRRGRSPWPLFAYGSVGTGKSRFALIVSDWYGGSFFFFDELWKEYIALARGDLTAESSTVVPQFGDWIVSERAWLHQLVDTRILILDDVARRRDTEAGTARELLCKILDGREGKPTLAVSNIAPAEIEACYDARTASRLCGGSTVKIIGRDRRLMRNRGT